MGAFGSRLRPSAVASPATTEIHTANRRTPQDKLDLSNRVAVPATTTAQGRFTHAYAGELAPKQEKVAVHVLRDLHLGGGDPSSQTWKSRIQNRLQGVVPGWARVTHPRIVSYIGHAVVNGMPAVVTEWCPNGTLREYMRRDPTANKRALIRQVADGLKHLHTRKQVIVQGDLKPDNVMIGHDNKAMLSNYGLSGLIEKELGPAKAFGEFRDTVRYTAPELLRGNPCSTRSDVYAFGCLALEIMTGKQPFVLLNGDLAVMRAKMQGHAPSQADYPELPVGDPFWKLLQRCWLEKADQRPTMSQVVTELSSLGYKP